MNQYNKNNRLIIKIDGMSCSHCENRIKENIKKINGVKKVEINLKNKKAVIESDTNITSDIIKAINNLGYRVSL